MFCTKCGTGNPEGAKFCCSCGAPLEEINKLNENTTQEIELNNSVTELPEYSTTIPEYRDAPVEENIEKEKKRNKTVLLVILIVVPLLLIAAIIVFCIIYFGDGQENVAKAFKNTMEELEENNQLLNVLDFDELYKDGEYTVTTDIDTEIPSVGDVSVYSEVGIKDSTVQLAGDVNVSVIPSIEYLIQIDENEVRANTPLLDKYMFVYNYKADNTGYLMNSVDTETINAAISQIYQLAVNKPFSFEEVDDLAEDIVEITEDIKFSKGKSEKHVINGNEVSCKKYNMELSLQNLLDMVDALEEFFEENVGEISWYSEIKNSLDQLRMDINMSNLTNIEAYVLVYKDLIAGIGISNGTDEYAVELCGGDYRAQNMKFLENGTVIGEIIGTKAAETEILTFKDGDSDAYVTYEYNPTDGRLNISVSDMDEISMKIKREEDRVDVDLDFINLGDTYFGGTLSLKKGAELKEMSGERFDIGQATEEEYYGLVGELSGLLLGLLGF